MQVETISIECSVTKSRNYQIAKVGMSMVITVDEGEDRIKKIAEMIDWATDMTNLKAEDAINKVLSGK